MSERSAYLPFAFAVLIMTLGGVLWHVAAVGDTPQVTTTTEELGGADRFLTSIATDKPIYRPGERVYARGTLLHHTSNKPLVAGSSVYAAIEIKGPKGDTVASGQATSAPSSIAARLTR